MLNFGFGGTCSTVSPLVSKGIKMHTKFQSQWSLFSCLLCRYCITLGAHAHTHMLQPFCRNRFVQPKGGKSQYKMAVPWTQFNQAAANIEDHVKVILIQCTHIYSICSRNKCTDPADRRKVKKTGQLTFLSVLLYVLRNHSAYYPGRPPRLSRSSEIRQFSVALRPRKL